MSDHRYIVKSLGTNLLFRTYQVVDTRPTSAHLSPVLAGCQFSVHADLIAAALNAVEQAMLADRILPSPPLEGTPL